MTSFTPSIAPSASACDHVAAYDRIPKAKVRFSRHNIYTRDANTCQYCGRQLARSDLNLDHVKPRSQGGRTTWENVVCCCVDCNLAKGARTPEQAKLRLLRAPTSSRQTGLSSRGKDSTIVYWPIPASKEIFLEDEGERFCP